MIHFGATLRVLRMDAGIGLRELAGQIGVSSAYLSRVENGHDPIPTNERLAMLADALGISRAILFDLARQSGPVVTGYIQRVPAAGALLADFAQRDLCLADIARVRAFVDREFPHTRLARTDHPALSRLLAAGGVTLGVVCSSLAELMTLAAARLSVSSDLDVSAVARTLIASQEQALSWLGGGVLAPHVVLKDVLPHLIVVTLRQPLEIPAPVPLAVHLVFVLVTRQNDAMNMSTMATLARLASYPDVLARILVAQSAKQVLDAVHDAESVW